MSPLLTKELTGKLETITKHILEATPAEKIYLLGSVVIQRRTESIFLASPQSCQYVRHYYLLVLTKANNYNVIQDKIENICRPLIPVTAIVLEINQLNQWRKEGHAFAHTVDEKAELLYDNETELEELNATEEEAIHKANESFYAQGLNKVQEFLAGADLYRIREQNKMAAFMLHQSAEHPLNTILKVITGLHVATHNLDKLIRYCSMFDYKIPELFPRNNDKNERLFQLLQKAYLDSRYKGDYSITTPELLILTERIKELQKTMQNICNTKLKEHLI